MKRFLVVAVLCVLLLMMGCAQRLTVPNPLAPFRTAVEEGDEALAGGYVYGAWQWYKAALAADMATDPDGRLAFNEDRTKRLFYARQQLSRPGVDESLRSTALVLSDYAVTATETLRARDRTIDGLAVVRDALQAECADATVRVEAGVLPKNGPWTVMVTRTVGREWSTSLKPVPGPLGQKLRDAAAALDDAAKQLSRASAAKTPAASRLFLTAALESLQHASEQMDAGARTQPQLLPGGILANTSPDTNAARIARAVASAKPDPR